MTFAQHTTVPVEKTRAEIDKLLGRHGATQRGVMQDDEKQRAIVAFAIQGAKYKIEVSLKVKATRRTERSDQVLRTRWRLVLLALKTKLELVALGVSSVEHEFMADMVLPNGKTVQENLGDFINADLETTDRGCWGGGS